MSYVNFWLDVVALLAVTFTGWVAAMLQAVFPPPSQSAGWVLWGWDYDAWARAQFAAICVCAVVILLHIMLHWNWVCSIVATKVLRLKTRPDDGMQTIFGVGTLVVLLHLILGGIIWAMFAVQRPA